MDRRLTRERPADAPDDIDDEGRDVDHESDVFELRFCEHPECGEPLPLDKPGHRIWLSDEPLLVCSHCFHAHRGHH